MTNKERRRRHRQLQIIREIILCIVTLIAVTFALFFMLKYRHEKAANEEAQAQLELYNDPANPYYSTSEVDDMVESARKEGVEEGKNSVQNTTVEELLDNIKSDLVTNNSSINTIRSLYPDDIVLVDSGQYYFLPINYELKLNKYDNDKFVRDSDGRMSYDDSSVKARFGIDVSKFQGTINWSRVADADIDFAIIRAGNRGYTKGDIFEDDNFEDNIEGAIKNKIDVGVYFFTQATSEEEAIEEAKFVLDLIEPYKITYPVVLDVEAIGGSSGRGNALTVEERTQYAKAFCDTIIKAGYDAMIYGNPKSLYLMLDLSELEDYPKWFAGYSDTPYDPYEFSIWQYSEKGKIAGITETVDLNISFYDPDNE